MSRGAGRQDMGPRPPMERYETIRQEITGVLERFGPMSAREISAEVRIREREVCGHLEHIRRSLEKTDRKLVVTAPQCRKCGYVFDERKKLTKPGKCPSCRSTSIDEPLFSVK